MKKLIIVTLALSGLWAGSAKAQMVDDREELKFGLKAGINISNVYDEQKDQLQADSKVGFAGGAFLSIPIGKYLGVQPEVLFSQKGYSGSGSFLGTQYTATRTSNFLDIPIYLQFKPVPFTTILFGPQYCFLLKQRDHFNAGALSSDQETQYSNDNIRKNIFGLATGIDITINRFVLGGRAAWDLQNNHGDGTSDSPRYKNVWFQITGGFKF